MTRKKFVSALLDAIGMFATIGDDVDLESAAKFSGCKVGAFFGVDEDGSNEVEHYLLLELKDGTRWRIIPERVLQLDSHEKILWEEFRRAEEAGELDTRDKDSEDDDDDDDDDNQFLPPPDLGLKGDD